MRMNEAPNAFLEHEHYLPTVNVQVELSLAVVQKLVKDFRIEVQKYSNNFNPVYF